MNLYLAMILVSLFICSFRVVNEAGDNPKIIFGIVVGLLIIWIGILIYIYFKFFSKNKKAMTKRYGYFREIVGNYGPEVLGYLLTYKKIKTEYLTASIMELIRRKIFVVISQDDGSFIIRDNDTSNKNDMSASEIYLKEWLIKSVGNGYEFNSNDLYIASHDIEKKKLFDSSFDEWSKLVIELGKKENFFNDKLLINNKSIGTFIFLNVGILYCLFGIFINMEVVHSFGIIILFIIFAIMVVGLSIFNFDFCSELRTLKGNEEYYKWMGFKNFILNYSNFNDKSIEDIYLWEKYLVYASVLGITDDINLKLDINDIGITIDEEHPLLVALNKVQRKIGLIVLDYKRKK